MRTAGLGALLVTATIAASCGPIDKLLGKDTPTPTPSGVTPTPSGTGSGTPTPLPTPVQSTSGEITTFDWGTVALPAGASPTFAFTAPANTIDVQFQAIGSAADASSIFVFFTLSSPAGTPLDNTAAGPEKQAPTTGLAAFALPASDSAVSVVGPGSYTFHIAAFSQASGNPAVASHPHVLAKVRTRAGGLANNNILDLNIVGVVGGRTAWNSASTGTTIQNDTVVQNALAEMATDYASMNVTFGTVKYYFLNDATFTTVGTEAVLEQLFQTSTSTGNNAHTIFLIHDFNGADFPSGVVGISGGIPIPHDTAGTLHSGVAVAMSSGLSTTGIGDDMAHESGHALGLFHTSEQDGQNYDPISDTAQCSSAQMSANPSGCPDVGNVMFWELDSVGAVSFSAGQGKVVRPAINLHSGASFAPSTSFNAGELLTRRTALEHGANLTSDGMVVYCKLHARDVKTLGIPEGGLRSLD